MGSGGLQARVKNTRVGVVGCKLEWKWWESARVEVVGKNYSGSNGYPQTHSVAS